jgi:energy-coupling factor transporter ATP-binding protein EcfA2
MDPTTKAIIEATGHAVNLAVEQGWFSKLLNALKKKHRILVLGSTGVGKTNLLESLKAIVPPAISAMSRTEFVEKRGFKIETEPFIFIDTPGQIGHKARRRDAIREAMRDGISGVINVVAYGYHEHRSGHEEAFDSTGKVSESYLTTHRDLEIALLSEWTGLLGDERTAGWLMTVVTKADLWWGRRKEVDEYYRNADGAYAKAIQVAGDLNPITVDYFSVFHKFYGQGELSGLLDDTDRVRMRSDLLLSLLAGVADK